MDIEQLAKETLLADTQQPPESAWDAIAQQLDTPTAAPRRRRTYLWAAAVALLLGTGATALLLRPKAAEKPTAQEVEAKPPAAPAQALEEPLRPIAEAAPSEAKPLAAARPAAPTSAAAPEPAGQMAALPSTVAPQRPAGRQEASAAPRPSASSTPAAPSPSPMAEAQQSTQHLDKTQLPAPQPSPQDTLIQYLPNFISPNGDGENDCFVIPGAERYSQITLELYNSRGQRVYKTSRYENDFCGGSLPEGDYYYVVRFYLPDQSPSLRRGVLVLKR